MSIYLIGCLVAFLVAMIMTLIDYYNGARILLGEVLIATLMITVLSWPAAILMVIVSLPVIIEILNEIKFKRKPK